MSVKERSKRASDNLPRPRILGEQIWCPLCNDYADFIKIAKAMRLATVHRRTIYVTLKRARCPRSKSLASHIACAAVVC
jgi:hypothetical protein